VPAEVPGDLLPVTARLSPRELAILRLVAGGYSNKEIGKALGISDGTVKNHLSDILRKLEARDRTHAVLKAIAARML
jgi:DNA-binding NarL/FixJ family response regulator